MNACWHRFKIKSNLFCIEQRFIKDLINGHMYNTFPTTCSFIKQSVALYFSNLLLMFLLAFYSHPRVYHLFGASIPAIWVPLVTSSCEFIRLSIRNLGSSLELKRINTHVITCPFLTVCHHVTDIDFMCFQLHVIRKQIITSVCQLVQV